MSKMQNFKFSIVLNSYHSSKNHKNITPYLIFTFITVLCLSDKSYITQSNVNKVYEVTNDYDIFSVTYSLDSFETIVMRKTKSFFDAKSGLFS